MDNTEKLKRARDLTLKLHKALVDLERSRYEAMRGPVTSTQFLSALLEDENFAWLRRFSTLIVDIDEMFAQRDGFTSEAVDAHFSKLSELIASEGGEGDFSERYRQALATDTAAAGIQVELKELIGN